MGIISTIARRMAEAFNTHEDDVNAEIVLEDAYDAGYDRGFQDGQHDPDEDVLESAYEAGRQDGQEAFDDGAVFDRAYALGYDRGFASALSSPFESTVDMFPASADPFTYIGDESHDQETCPVCQDALRDGMVVLFEIHTDEEIGGWDGVPF
jgi:hypothetical protein